MKLGIVNNETWAFFKEVHTELANHHTASLFEPKQLEVPLFRERLNRTGFDRQLRQFLSANDVVFFEWASAWLAAASRLPKTSGLVTRLHRYEMYQWADQINWQVVDRVILVSQAKQREFVTRFPDQAAKVVVIPEAISLQRFTPHQRPFSGELGILCHLSPRKRVYELILAFHTLIQQSPNFRLHIGGGRHPRFPEYRDALHRLTNALKLQDRVVFYENVTEPEQWLANIDIFISNSYSEGLQVSPMEAIASGCYCLSHAWDGADELLPEGNLYYTDPQLIERLQCYAALSEAERLARQTALREMVHERFDVDKIKVQIRQVVEAVYSERR